MKKYLFIVALGLACSIFLPPAYMPAVLADHKEPTSGKTPLVKAQVLKELPHNIKHFTQGLFFHQGKLYESAGRYGHSSIAIKDPQSGRSLLEKPLEPQFFGEGATLAGDSVYLLTWRENLGFVLDQKTLTEKGRFLYQGEGWGLTFDGERLIRSNGSDTLYFHALDGKPIGTLKVHEAGRPVTGLNELEWIPAQRLILANIWGIPEIAAIGIDDGRILFRLDLTNLVPEEFKDSELYVLNGIALAPDGNSLWVTGKCWPVMYVLDWPAAP